MSKIKQRVLLPISIYLEKAIKKFITFSFNFVIRHYLIMIVLLCIGCLLTTNTPLFAISSLAKNDAFPVFTTRDPHTFLLTKEKLKFKDIEWAEQKGDRIDISVSAFGQNADRGKTIKGEDTFTFNETTDTATTTIIPLGDLTGRSSMIALLYGNLPQGEAYGPFLQTARDTLFPGVAVINDQTEIDPAQEFGYFSFPLEYRKRGVRFELAARVFNGIGISVQAGVSTIRQVVEDRDNLTSKADPKEFDLKPEDVDRVLMKELDNIAQEIKLDIRDFCETSIEEIRFNLFWRYAYELNEGDDEWSHFLLIPFLQVTGSISPGKKKDSSRLFALPFGNNDHHAAGFTAGLNFDFIETIEVGCEVGFTHFFDKSFTNFRVPNSQFQTTIFPFATNVKVSPGHNWHFGAKISAYHFLDKLSMHFHYLIVEHKEDSIKLKKEDSAFIPRTLEKVSSFKTKLANIGFNYDLSPNVAAGFLWQAPFSQRNTYRSTTVMFSFMATF